MGPGRGPWGHTWSSRGAAGGQKPHKGPTVQSTFASLPGLTCTEGNSFALSREEEKRGNVSVSAQHAAEASGVRYSLLALCFSCDDELVCVADAVSRRTSRPRANLECVKPLDQAISFFAGKTFFHPSAASFQTAAASCYSSASSCPHSADPDVSGEVEGCRVGSLRLSEGTTKSHVSQLKPHPLCPSLLLCCTFGGDVLLLDCSEARRRARSGFASGLRVEEDEGPGLLDVLGVTKQRGSSPFPRKGHAAERTDDGREEHTISDDAGYSSASCLAFTRKPPGFRLLPPHRERGERGGGGGGGRITEEMATQQWGEGQKTQEEEQLFPSGDSATAESPRERSSRGGQGGEDLYLTGDLAEESRCFDQKDQEEAERNLSLQRSRAKRHLVHWDGGCVVLRKIRLGDQCCWLDMAWAPNGLQFAGSHRLGCLSVFADGKQTLLWLSISHIYCRHPFCYEL